MKAKLDHITRSPEFSPVHIHIQYLRDKNFKVWCKELKYSYVSSWRREMYRFLRDFRIEMIITGHGVRWRRDIYGYHI